MPHLATRYAVVLSTDRATMAALLEGAFRRAGIPHHSGLQVSPEPRLVVSVPEARLAEARVLAAQVLGRPLAFPLGMEAAADAEEREQRDLLDGPAGLGEQEIEDDEEDALAAETGAEPARALPRGPLLATTGLALLHLLIVVTLVGERPTSTRLAALGALSSGTVLAEPWRLLTSLVLHLDVLHAAWNGVGLVALGVPVVARYGWVRAAALYMAAGVGGNLNAVSGASPRTLFLGSSGAIAGLLGAWLVDRAQRARAAPMARREWLRVAGIGLLSLPALVTPTTAQGDQVSVAAHLGGLATGALLALVFSWKGETIGTARGPAVPPRRS